MISLNSNTSPTNKTNYYAKDRINHYPFRRKKMIKSIVYDVISLTIVFDRN